MPRSARSNVVPLPVAAARKPKGDARPTLTGQEENLLRIRELVPLIERAEEEVKAARSAIEEAARDAAWDIEGATGAPCVSLAVDPGDGSPPAILTFKATWKATSTSERETLAVALGERFSRVFRTEEKVSLRKGTDRATLRAMLGEEAFGKLAAVLEVSESLVPIPEEWDRERARAAASTDDNACRAFLGVDASRSVYFKAN